MRGSSGTASAQVLAVALFILCVLLLTGCSGDDRTSPSPQVAVTTESPAPSPSVEPSEVDAAPVTPADALFTEEPAGYSYERGRAIERLYRSQSQLVFSSAPPGIELHSVAARRVLEDAGEVKGSALTISVELADAALIPKFQQGLLSGLGEGLREIDIEGRPAFYKENFTANGQDVVVFFHRGTLAVEAFGVTPEAARDIAAALVTKLPR